MEGSCKKLSVDGISSLPSSIIDSILARLPLREAVRTSSLSKEWKYKWTSLPDLVFDFGDDPNVIRHSKLENVVYQVLHRHRGPIDKFSLSCTSSPDIDQCIQLLSASQVQDFTLLIFEGYRHRMTSHFFAFQNLKHLYLRNCTFKPPPEFKGFSKLAALSFQNVEYVPAIFEQFISRSPLLERLMLVHCTDLDAFEVQGPSLRVFFFLGVSKNIWFKRSPVLAEVILSKKRSSTGFKYSEIPRTVEKLHLHPCVLEFSGAGAGVVPRRLTDSLNSLELLDLLMYLDNIKEVASAFCLARSSPNLQMLRVTLRTSTMVEAVIGYIRSQETPDHYLHQLRCVKIGNFSSSEPEIELLRYLLASTAGLKEMVITINHSSLSNDATLMDLLMQFPWASPTAVVCVEGQQRSELGGYSMSLERFTNTL